MIKPAGMRVHCSPPPFLQLHLKTQVAPKVSFTCILGCAASVGTHPGTPIIVTNKKCGDMVAPCGMTCSLLNQTKCTQAPTERHCSPMEAVLVGSLVALPGSSRIFKAHPCGVDVDSGNQV